MLIGFVQYLRHKLSASQNSCIPFFPLFFLPTKETSLIPACTSDQATSLKFGASSLIYSIFDKLAVSSSGDSFSFTEIEQHIFDGFFC